MAVLADPALSLEVEALARAIAEAGADAETRAFARRVAEAQIDLVRVRRARLDLFARTFGNPSYASLDAIEKTLDAALDLGRDLLAGAPVPPESFNALDAKPEDGEKFAEVLSEMGKQLAAMDRYECRALARRKFAIRALDAHRRRAAKAANARHAVTGDRSPSAILAERTQ